MKKLPRRFTLASGEPFAFAGLWDVWQGDGQKLLTCCLITTTTNKLVGEVHNRMPVIVAPEHYGAWLAPKSLEADLETLMKPYPADLMRVAAANPILNSPKNDGPECLEAA
jgi:putative SOS response-associated peptidase YedK